MIFKQVIRFTNSSSGLEKILRLLQSLSQILAAWALASEEAQLWLHLRRQFALGRRYFRFFKFLDCFEKAWGCFVNSDGMQMVLGVGKWSSMGLYLGLESVTILDAIGVWTSPWAAVVMLEANRFWFYSLVCSIIGGLVQLFGSLEAGGGNGESGGKRKREALTAHKTRMGAMSKSLEGVKRRLVSDCFDLLIPGHVTGWISTSTATVGFATVISTVLSSKDIWDRLKE